MPTMILQMTGVTALYVAVTALLWRLWKKTERHTLLQKLAVGLFYGLCSVAANHFGILYGDMILNVRDIGPLAAGLFFDPLSGVLSGLIGGIERYIIGTYFGISRFTRVACSVSTILAGLLAAILHKWIYQGKRPTLIHCLFLGAEMEVFHMYAIFVTNRNSMAFASYVVKICAPPMIAFTGIGLMACAAVIQLLSGARWKFSLHRSKKSTPIDWRFQKWTLLVVLALFASSFFMNYNMQTQVAAESAETDLLLQRFQYSTSYEESKDVELLKKVLEDNNLRTDSFYVLADVEKMQQLTCHDSPDGSVPIDPENAALITKHAGGNAFSAALWVGNNEECMCISGQLDDRLYLLIGRPASSIYANLASQLMETVFLEILIFTALYLLISVLLDRLVVRNLDKINGSLARITAGHLNEIVSVEESSEFTKLSGDINDTVAALREYIDASEKRMEDDLKLAAAIQDSALPKNFNLPTENLEIYALMTPARQVGGDFYDFFYVGVDMLALVIADVSGKGIPASLFMMRSKTAIKNFARSGMGPAKLLENANNTLCEGNTAQMFVTVWLGILDLKTGLMRCANAGHEYPVLMRAGGDYELLKDKHGLVLAGYEDVPMKEYEIQLQSGDRLFVYTDGVPEAINENREQYGTKRLTERLNVLKDLPQQEILNGVLEDVRQFAGGEEQFDDITMLGITYTRSGPDPAGGIPSAE